MFPGTTGEYRSDWGMAFTGLVLIMAPTMLSYVFFVAAPDQGHHRGGAEGMNSTCPNIKAQQVYIIKYEHAGRSASRDIFQSALSRWRKMVQTQIELTEKQMEALEELAEQRHISISVLIGEGIDFLLQTKTLSYSEDQKKRALAAAGRFQSNLGDLAKNHDSYWSNPDAL
ncbi:MAG: ribbon-helix-helix protein, CopG family [Candidatus Latescibacteria bacterium]|nr:ribbon-helix-helix protein, CopG family [Candidatus Latescibacterota bacterium]